MTVWVVVGSCIDESWLVRGFATRDAAEFFAEECTEASLRAAREDASYAGPDPEHAARVGVATWRTAYYRAEPVSVDA